MPRLFNTGKWTDEDGVQHDLKPPTKKVNGVDCVAVPPMHHARFGHFVPCELGSAIISTLDGFWVVGPEQWVDLPHGIPVEDFRAGHSNLLTEEEAGALGFVHSDRKPLAPKVEEPKAKAKAVELKAVEPKAKE